MKRLLAALLIFGLVKPVLSQDTTVVISQATPVWRNPRLVEELRIGVLEGDDRYIFGQISELEVTRDGAIWVVDRQGPRVRIYDRNGRFDRGVYRVGSGPGEIKSVIGIALTPQGQIAVLDQENHRISLYHENGKSVSAFKAVTSAWEDENLRVDRSGLFWVYTNIRNPACIRRTTRPDGTVNEVDSGAPGCGRHAYLRYSTRGILVDTALVPAPDEHLPLGFVIPTPEGILRPFIPRWHYAVSPLGHFITAHSSKYAFNVVQPRGSDLRQATPKVVRVERRYPAVNLTREEKAEWEARADFAARRQPNAPGGRINIPDVKPALRSVSVDDDGRVWILRHVTAVKVNAAPTRSGGAPPLTWREQQTFDVWEPTGRFLGSLVVPRGVRLFVQRGLFVWGVLRGELDENYVVRYRIEIN